MTSEPLSLACQLGAQLMAACMTVVPPPDEPWVVKRACVKAYPVDVQASAKLCAAENKIRWRYESKKRRK